MSIENQSTHTGRLLDQAQQGDSEALDMLFANERAYLRRVVELRMDDELRGRIDASDVVQETQLAAARRFPEYAADRRVSFRLWLRQTAIDRLIDLRRHHVLAQKRTVRREARANDHSSRLLARRLLADRPSQIAQRQELTLKIREVVETMDDNDREILLLRHFEELTNAEISELLGIQLDTVRKRYGRAIRRFRDQLNSLDISGLH